MTLELEGVSLTLAGRPVLAGLDLRVGRGERVVVLGVNGCGKTSLLRVMDGLVAPTSGTVRWEGRPLDGRALDDPDLRRRFRSEVALLFQNVDAMLFNSTVADEIAFTPRQLGLADAAARASQWAEVFGVAGALERPPFELSGGEKKKVALAAVMAAGPRVLLLDEPTASLDPASAAHLVDLLAGLDGVTVVSTTHNLSVAAELGDRAVLLAPGRPGALYDGPTERLLADEPLLVESGLAHRHAHRHGGALHSHYHLHDSD